MEKIKKSSGIKLVSIFIIALGLWFFFANNLVSSMRIFHFRSYLLSIGFDMFEIIGGLFLANFYQLCLIVGGVGILFSKAWARILVLISSCIGAIINLTFVVVSYWNYIFDVEQYVIPSPFATIMSTIYMKLIIQILLIYYFTRPKVKEQFNRQKDE